MERRKFIGSAGAMAISPFALNLESFKNGDIEKRGYVGAFSKFWFDENGKKHTYTRFFQKNGDSMCAWWHENRIHASRGKGVKTFENGGKGVEGTEIFDFPIVWDDYNDLLHEVKVKTKIIKNEEDWHRPYQYFVGWADHYRSAKERSKLISNNISPEFGTPTYTLHVGEELYWKCQNPEHKSMNHVSNGINEKIYFIEAPLEEAKNNAIAQLKEKGSSMVSFQSSYLRIEPVVFSKGKWHFEDDTRRRDLCIY